MADIYWITRFGSIHCLGIVMFWISLTIFMILWIISISKDDWTGEDCCTEKQKHRLRKGANYSIVTFTPGPIVEDTVTPFMNAPFTVAGLIRAN